MVPGSFETFFLATAGAGAAFVGLLFIAISISPQHQRLAEATLLSLFNGFVVSCVGLIPEVNIGWIALVLGTAGALIATQLVGFLARSHRHVVSRRPPWLHRLRVVSLSVIATFLYAIEALLGLQLILRPHDEDGVRWLAVIVISIYTLGMLRAWTLLGDPQYGWSGWLNPLQDLTLEPEATSETDNPMDAAPS
jgi:hypothetical protein